MPSWWECSSCALCAFGPDATPPPPALHNSAGSCPRCTGCTHHLEMLNLTVALSRSAVKSIRMHYGNTGASLFLATDSVGEEAVLKVHGLVTNMVSAGKLNQLVNLYRGKRYLAHELLLARALSRLADECGLGHINIRERVAAVRAVIPLTGEKLEEARAVLAEHARGVSLEMLTIKLEPAELQAALAAVPHAALRDAALYDLLFVQGDRHAENVFVGEGGYLKLIDSRDAALEEGLDSVFFPSTISFERNRVGNQHMFNRSAAAVTHHWPQTQLDYRCHVPGGALGTQLPAQVRQCVTKWAAMTPQQLVEEYFWEGVQDAQALTASNGGPLHGRPELKAARLVAQSQALLVHGFERALQLTRHKNATGMLPLASGFPAQPPCCRVVQATPGRSEYSCAPDGHQTLPDNYAYPPLDLSLFAARPAAQTQAQPETQAQPAQAQPAAHAQPSAASPAANRAAWVARVGDDIVSAGGDVFDAVPASGFDPAFKNPCWRNATGLFCLPAFHIIGVSKCGTTDLYHRLSMHPHLAPTHNKGPHFWDEPHSVDWYLRIYSDAAAAIARDPQHKVVGDASSNTLTFSGVGVRNTRHPPGGVTLPAVLAALQPGLRMVAVLRDPVERMYSAFFYYQHYAQRFGATAEGFHAFASAQLAAYSACSASSSRRQCAVEGYGHAEQLTKGLYSMFIPDFFAAFPRQQLLVLRSEAYFQDVSQGLRAVMRHLDLADPPPADWERMVGRERSNARASNGAARGSEAGEMLPQTRALLSAFYRPYNEELAALLGDDSFLSWHAGGVA